MRHLRYAFAALAVALTLVPAAADARSRATHRVVATKASDCAGAALVPTQANLAAIRSATLCLLNVERTRRGLSALRSQGDLGLAADQYARAMVANKFFSHVSPNGSTFLDRIKRTGYLTRASGWAVGENLAWGEAELGSPASTVSAWMRSPDHMRNMLSGRYVEVGIGIAYGTPRGGSLPGATYVTEFGTRSLIARASRRTTRA